MLNAKLVVVGGEAKTTEVPLNLPTIIGRGREVSLTLPHPLVSRQHCELFERDGKLLVRDLNSLNGTYVDNRRIEKSEILKPDQLLTIGNVTFRAVYHQHDESEKDTEFSQAKAETEQLDPPGSVIESVETAAADADSKIGFDDQADSIHTRPTTPGNRSRDPAIREPDAAAIADNDNTPDNESFPVGSAGSSVISGDHSSQRGATPEHSVCAALIDAGLACSPSDATISDIHRQLPAIESGPSKIDEFSVHEEDQPPPKVGESFAGFETEHSEQENVEPDESALGSFIRKLPR